MKKLQCLLTKGMQVVNSWWSDQPGYGLVLLSLGTTSRIHSKTYRAKTLSAIDGKINWNRSWMGIKDEVNEHSRDIPALEDLSVQVGGTRVGEEWLTDSENVRFNEESLRAGRLV